MPWSLSNVRVFERSKFAELLDLRSKSSQKRAGLDAPELFSTRHFKLIVFLAEAVLAVLELIVPELSQLHR